MQDQARLPIEVAQSPHDEGVGQVWLVDDIQTAAVSDYPYVNLTGDQLQDLIELLDGLLSAVRSAEQNELDSPPEPERG